MKTGIGIRVKLSVGVLLFVIFADCSFSAEQPPVTRSGFFESILTSDEPTTGMVLEQKDGSYIEITLDTRSVSTSFPENTPVIATGYFKVIDVGKDSERQIFVVQNWRRDFGFSGDPILALKRCHEHPDNLEICGAMVGEINDEGVQSFFLAAKDCYMARHMRTLGQTSINVICKYSTVDYEELKKKNVNDPDSLFVLEEAKRFYNAN